jgi:hypothetical protein
VPSELVSHAGLVPVMGLAQRADRIDDAVGRAPDARVNPRVPGSATRRTTAPKPPALAAPR